VKPGFQVDNPSDLHEVRTSVPGWQHLQQYGATARLTAALTSSTTLVSLTAFRRLHYSFSLDSDITELDVSTFDQPSRSTSYQRRSRCHIGGRR
jgi:hypothetical protein